MPDERPLPRGHGGSDVSLSSAGVHRTTGPWTPTVHAFLRHLRAQGFDGAPDVVGIDDSGREVLSYVEGQVLADPAWRPGEPVPWPVWARTEEALVATGRMLRQLHDASAGFVPPADPVWKQHPWPTLLPGEVVCHGDIGPHNTVYRDGLPVAFIDWETIRPELPLVELGHACWRFVPLGDDAYFARSGFGETPDLARRLAAFVTAYGVTDPDEVLWALQQAKQRSAAMLRHYPVDAEEAAGLLALFSRDLAWLHEHRFELVGQLA